MTGSDGAPDQTDADAARTGAVDGTGAHPAAEVIFDPELFEELRGTIGLARLQLALTDLAATLPGAFAVLPGPGSDPDATFQTAHRLTGRAGLMGFTALQDACAQVQQACAARDGLDEALDRARRITLLTQDVVKALLQQGGSAVIP